MVSHYKLAVKLGTCSGLFWIWIIKVLRNQKFSFLSFVTFSMAIILSEPEAFFCQPGAESKVN